jgi:hypothetical protein
MADLSGNILALQSDELGRPTNIEAMVSGDVIPQSMGGTGSPSISLATGFSLSGTTVTLDPIVTEVDFGTTTEIIVARQITYATSLSGHPDSTTTIDGAVTMGVSSITVSSCPVPPPWSFVEVTADDGENTATPYYFASGSTQAKTELLPSHILWDSSESYFTIANAGYYEFEMQGSVIVASSPTTITTSIVQTDGLGGTEIEKIDKAQVVRTNIDPHDIMIKWVGYCTAVNYTCKIDGTAAVVMQKGSTFTCKRLI